MLGGVKVAPKQKEMGFKRIDEKWIENGKRVKVMPKNVAEIVPKQS